MPCEVIPGRLYQGGLRDLWNGRVDLPDAELDAVVSLTRTVRPDFASRGLLHVMWPVADGPLPDPDVLAQVVEVVVGLVEAGKPTLVHCAQGVNRSGLVVALALRKLEGCSGEEAVARLRSRCPGVLRNQTFVDYVQGLGPPD